MSLIPSPEHMMTRLTPHQLGILTSQVKSSIRRHGAAAKIHLPPHCRTSLGKILFKQAKRNAKRSSILLAAFQRHGGGPTSRSHNEERRHLSWATLSTRRTSSTVCECGSQGYNSLDDETSMSYSDTSGLSTTVTSLPRTTNRVSQRQSSTLP